MGGVCLVRTICVIIENKKYQKHCRVWFKCKWPCFLIYIIENRVMCMFAVNTEMMQRINYDIFLERDRERTFVLPMLYLTGHLQKIVHIFFIINCNLSQCFMLKHALHHFDWIVREDLGIGSPKFESKRLKQSTCLKVSIHFVEKLRYYVRIINKTILKWSLKE